MSISEKTAMMLITEAVKVRENAYAPYSGFKVGAALITGSGKVYLGCNIENAAFGDTVCAERVAIFTAIAAGERDFCAMAIAGGKDELSSVCSPCGSCRQVLSEFCPKDFVLVLGTPESYELVTLGEILPRTFELC